MNIIKTIVIFNKNTLCITKNAIQLIGYSLKTFSLISVIINSENQITFLKLCTLIVLITEMMVVDEYFPQSRDGVLLDSLITLAYGGK